MIAIAGLLAAVALPVVGVGVGVTQIVRGVANTPEALMEQHKGKSWDQVKPVPGNLGVRLQFCAVCKAVPGLRTSKMRFSCGLICSYDAPCMRLSCQFLRSS